MTAADAVRRPQRRLGTAVGLALAIVALAASLRVGVSSVGVLLPQLREELGLSAPLAGVLTSLPVLCFALVGLGGGRLILRLGVHRAAALLLAALTLGLAVRALTDDTADFLLATTVAMAAAALGNVVLPPLTKLHFPHRLTLISGLYGAALTGSAALPAALSAPIAAESGLRWALGGWAAVAGVALLLWLPRAFHDPRGTDGRPATSSLATVARTRLGWAMALCFACQAAHAYVQFGYWGDIQAAAGIEATHAGALLGLIAACGIPVALALPALIRLTRNGVALPIAFGVLTVIGWVGVVVAPFAFHGWLWAVVLGIGGGAFPWCLAMIALRSRTTTAAAQLSAFTQGVGYLLAAVSTFGASLLREATGTWNVPIGVLLVLAVVMAVAGSIAVRAQPLDV